jgi:hypothetical protein
VVTALFADIRGSTALAHDRSSAELLGEIVVGPTAWRQAADLVETEGILYETETAELKGVGTMTIRRLRPHLQALYASPSQYGTCPTAIPGRERRP